MDEGTDYQEYKGMINRIISSEEIKKERGIKLIWKIGAHKEGKLKGEENFVALRTGFPNEEFYVVEINDLYKCGRDLIDKLISEGK